MPPTRWVAERMLTYPTWVKPDLLHLGPLRVRWYGIMYLLGFLVGRVISRRLCKRGFVRLNPDAIDDYLVALFAGMVLGARIVYMLVYYRASPEEPFKWWTPFAIWEGGLAFHGAVIGMVLATWWFARRHQLRLFNMTDLLALAGGQGIIFGRLGNFINAELPGRPTDSRMGMQFPVRDYDGKIEGYTEPRHPSQLYEAVGEGLIPFALIWLLKPYVRYQGVLGGLWLCFYAVARFCIEFFREKDAQLSYYLGWMTMGQILCALMFLIGLGVVLYNQAQGVPITGPPEAQGEEVPVAGEQSTS
jgi:phosphatidylglycerol:prolipoprotein diacylglycerol transferase